MGREREPPDERARDRGGAGAEEDVEDERVGAPGLRLRVGAVRRAAAVEVVELALRREPEVRRDAERGEPGAAEDPRAPRDVRVRAGASADGSGAEAALAGGGTRIVTRRDASPSMRRTRSSFRPCAPSIATVCSPGSRRTACPSSFAGRPSIARRAPIRSPPSPSSARTTTLGIAASTSDSQRAQWDRTIAGQASRAQAIICSRAARSFPCLRSVWPSVEAAMQARTVSSPGAAVAEPLVQALAKRVTHEARARGAAFISR